MWAMTDRQPDPPPCPECDAPMRLVRIMPKVGGLMELHSFYCEPCGFVETRAQDSKS